MALSGSIDTSSNAFWASDGSRYFVLSWSATQSKPSNHRYGRSTVSWTLKGGGTSAQGIYCKNWQCVIGPDRASNLSGTKTKLYNGTVLASGSFDIDHDANGDASFYLGISGYIYYYGSNYERKASATHSLNKITYRFDINVYNPDGKQDCDSASFDEYIGETRVANDVTNEDISYIDQPYYTFVSVADIKPLKHRPYYQLKQVRNDGRIIDKGSNGRWGHYITGYSDNIYIDMEYKHTTLTWDRDGGAWSTSSGIAQNDTSREMIYNSTTGAAPVPVRTGYKFKGWFTGKNESGTQVFNANGSINTSATSYWNSGGGWLQYNNVTLYAGWEIQNVAYVKTKEGWKLATIYVKTESGWKPAILYVKTANGWKQSITK